MAKNEVEEPLLGKAIERQGSGRITRRVSGRIPRVNEDYVFAPDSEAEAVAAPPASLDLESQGSVRITRRMSGRIITVSEDNVTAPESEAVAGAAPVSKEEQYSPHRKLNSWSAVLAVSVCCIAIIVFVSAGVASYNSNQQQKQKNQQGYGDVEQHKSQQGYGDVAHKGGLKGGPNANSAGNDFYRASKTTYHFQPEKYWMNDPNAPMYYGGFYHFFYQCNPDAAVFGNISWGHAVSTDLIHWMYLDVALRPDQWYDLGGCWSGSATILKDGTPAIIYTAGRNDEEGNAIQTQALALPVDPTDPLLRKWFKYDKNPIMLAPVGFKPDDFRDPTTAWLEDDGFWRLIIGTKLDNADGTKDGMALLYKSTDFLKWDLEPAYLHDVPGTGMWECVDIYPITTEPKSQLENTAGLRAQNQFGLQHHASVKAENYIDSFKYVLKASLDTWVEDHYAIGTYSTQTHKFTVDDIALDLGEGHRYDYGKFYASKTFYDSSTGRRILWSWVNESDTQLDDIVKGWASLQAIPRTVWLDDMTMTNLLTWPVEEVDALRGAKTSYENVTLYDGDVIKVEGGDGPQLDILISFEKPDFHTVGNVNPENFDCSQGGSAQKGIFGPFGLLVHTDDTQKEQTAVFFYITPLANGEWSTRVCSDQSRSSLAQNIDKTVYGSYVTVLPDENEIKMRVLLDHSIVETFAMGGRMAITSRVYPTKALNENSHLFLFNNGSTPIKITKLDVYQMVNVHMFAI